MVLIFVIFWSVALLFKFCAKSKQSNRPIFFALVNQVNQVNWLYF